MDELEKTIGEIAKRLNKEAWHNPDHVLQLSNAALSLANTMLLLKQAKQD